LKYAYYPGCSLHASAKEYDLSWRAVCKQLDIELAEMADWNCCGTVHATSVDGALATALSARNLTIAEEMGLDIAVPCNGCYKNLRVASETLRQNGALRDKVNGCLSRPFQGSSAVRHPLYIILEDVGLERLSEVPKPLAGLKVAPYYGCVLTRPAATPPLDDPEDPQGMDRLLEALGAKVVPYGYKTKCCGGAVLVSHNDVSLDLIGKLLLEAKKAGAECLAVACPMCQMALDAYQARVERKLKERLDLPILYFTQLLGLALGLSNGELGLGRLFVSPSKALARV
jgi:heterodisulfide reductase subunit B